MRIIYATRGPGKTSKAVEIANETGAYLIVADRKRAQQVFRDYRPYRFPVTFDELLTSGMCGSYVRNVVIDDADELVQRICHSLKIDAVTWTKEEPNK